MERRRKHQSHRPSKNTSHCRIALYNRQPIKITGVKEAVSFFLREKKVECQKLSVYFVGKKKITALHGQFFDDPTPTDCITFPIDEEFLGEIFICPEAALEYNPKKPAEEITLYLFHCLLHLLGYDDIDKKKRVKMRREEKRLLALARKHRCILEISS
jgi:probable rRNA maturation factor